MKNTRSLRTLGLIAIGIFVLLNSGVANAQAAKKAKVGKICGNPTMACKTTVTFEANDIAFQVPANANIWDSEEFYAIILKSVGSPDDSCDTFVPEDQRLAAQSLFPKMKVFTSRCSMGGGIYYSNVTPNQMFMAVYAGATKAQAERTLTAVKATGKFPGANIRRMHVGFNGT